MGHQLGGGGGGFVFVRHHNLEAAEEEIGVYVYACHV